VEGPVLLFPTAYFLWQKVGTVDDITFKSLEIFKHLKPTTDLLFIGTGEKMELIHEDLVKELSNIGIGVEVMSSASALSTFNICNDEGRKVACALLANDGHKWGDQKKKKKKKKTFVKVFRINFEFSIGLK